MEFKLQQNNIFCIFFFFWDFGFQSQTETMVTNQNPKFVNKLLYLLYVEFCVQVCIIVFNQRHKTNDPLGTDSSCHGSRVQRLMYCTDVDAPISWVFLVWPGLKKTMVSRNTLPVWSCFQSLHHLCRRSFGPNESVLLWPGWKKKKREKERNPSVKTVINLL